MSDKDLIVMGRFGAPHGVLGWIRIISHCRPPEQIFKYPNWYIQTSLGEWLELDKRDTQKWSKKLLIKPIGVQNRSEIEHLVNQDIAILRHDLPKVKNQYYWADLTGCKVESINGLDFGNVVSLMETGANDVLICKDKDGQEHLIPFKTPEVIKTVDIEQKYILVDWAGI
jgi:16S rRNA processing protein RimM